MRRLREKPGDVLGADLLHIGQLSLAERGQRLRRDVLVFVRNVTFSHGLDSFHIPSGRVRYLFHFRYVIWTEPDRVLFVLIDSDCLNDLFRLRPCKVDRQQPVFQVRALYLHPLRQHEGALEVACGNAAMDVLPGLVVLLPAADDKLVFLNGYIELVTGETRHRQRDPEPFGLAVGTVAALDIVGRVAVGTLYDAVERPLDFVESQQERTG